jgi:hypothetical protein
VFTEEWFTADYSGFYKLKSETWQNKLLKLSRVLKEVDYKILVTIRDPFDLSYSQYLPA